MLKVALINNMNNNFFSLARFLRDKGVDAHLFQVDDLDDHFLPQCDTFEDLSCCNYIHEVSDLNFRDFYKMLFLFKSSYQLRKFRTKLKEFDLVIACGGLAILERAGINIDIFVPYGGDLYQSPFMFEYSIKKHFPYSVLMKQYIKFQRRAISKSRAIIALASIDRHMYDALIKLNEKWIDWGIPMIYPLPDNTTTKWHFLNSNDFILFSHARQNWKTALDYKGNDKAIRAYARFIKNQKHYANPIMVLFEYGVDVDASKVLIHELGIDDYVHWMPTMNRKFIYEGLNKSSLVFDFFHDEVVSFGGVTFEAFCCSKPVIGNSKLKNLSMSHSVPLVHAYTEDEIYNVLMDYSVNPIKYIEQGKLSKKWFDENVGSGLANKYISLIEYLAVNKDSSLKNNNCFLPKLHSYLGPDFET